MVFLYILLALVVLIIVLQLLPLHVYASFIEGQLECYVRYLFIKYRVYPKKKPEEKEKSAVMEYLKKVLRSLKSEKKKKPKPSGGKKKKQGVFAKLKKEHGLFGAIRVLLRTAASAADLAVFIIRRVNVDRLECLIAVGGEDAADAAVRHGQLCASLYPALSLALCAVHSYKRVNIDLRPDFCAPQNRYHIRVAIHVLPGRAMHGIVRMVWQILKAEITDRTEDAKLQAVIAVADEAPGHHDK